MTIKIVFLAPSRFFLYKDNVTDFEVKNDFLCIKREKREDFYVIKNIHSFNIFEENGFRTKPDKENFDTKEDYHYDW